MPKKGKGKSPGPAGGKSAKPEPLPQVWLPDQPTLDGGSFSSETEGRGEAAATTHPPPLEKEEQQMALLWAMEEVNSPKGWDEEEELDYSAVSRRREERKENESVPDLFRYAQSSVFTVKFLGHLGNEQGQRGAESRQSEVLETIDAAQRQGRLPWVTSDQDQRILSLSKYGIKVTDEKRQRVFARHALHFIVNIMYYEDMYCKHMIAIKVGRPDVATFDLYIYECMDEAQAKDICLTLAQAFEAVSNKMKLEQNLHTSNLH